MALVARSQFLGLPDFSGEAEAARSHNEEAAVTYTKEQSIMGQRTVVPAAQWMVEALYLKAAVVAELQGVSFGIVKPVYSFKLTAILFRGPYPVWIDEETIPPVPTKFLPELGTIALGVEFVSPVLVLPGETLSMKLQFAAGVTWEQGEKKEEPESFKVKLTQSLGTARYSIGDYEPTGSFETPGGGGGMQRNLNAQAAADEAQRSAEARELQRQQQEAQERSDERARDREAEEARERRDREERAREEHEQREREQREQRERAAERAAAG